MSKRHRHYPVGAVEYGESGGSKGLDFTVYSDTNAHYLGFDASTDVLTFIGTTFALTAAFNITGAVVITGALSCSGDFTVHTDDFVVDVDGNITMVPTGGAVEVTGQLDVSRTSATAGGTFGLNSDITQGAGVGLTGTLRGGYFTATNGNTAATGAIRGIEVKARAANTATPHVGNTVAVLTAGYFSADAKNKQATILRGLEVELAGEGAATSTTAQGLVIFNNSSGTQTTSIAVDINGGVAAGHKAFTTDLRLQNGETIDNATDGILTFTATTLKTAAILDVDYVGSTTRAVDFQAVPPAGMTSGVDKQFMYVRADLDRGWNEDVSGGDGYTVGMFRGYIGASAGGMIAIGLRAGINLDAGVIVSDGAGAGYISGAQITTYVPATANAKTNKGIIIAPRDDTAVAAIAGSQYIGAQLYLMQVTAKQESWGLDIYTESGCANLDAAINIRNGGAELYTYIIDMSGCSASTDIRLCNGETISNVTDGKILLTATTVETSAALNVIGDLTVNTTKFTVTGATGDLSSYNQEADATGVTWTAKKSRAAGAAAVNSDVVLSIVGQGMNATPTLHDVASIDYVVTNVGAGTEAGKISFLTVVGGVALAEKFSITSTVDSAVDFRVNTDDFIVDIDGSITLAPTGGTVAVTGQIDLDGTSAAAGGMFGVGAWVTQGTGVGLTGTLRGGYFVATNGDTAATGTVRGVQVIARAATGASTPVGANVALIQGIYLEADARNKTATTLRGLEISLDGLVGGSSTLAQGVVVFNNSSAVQTTSVGFDVNGGTATGHKAFTYDVRLQNGATVANSTAGTVAITVATAVDLVGGGTDPVLKLSGAGSKSPVEYGTAGTAWADTATPAFAADQMYARINVGGTVYRLPLWADS